MIDALCEHANAFCGETSQKCASTFIDGRNIENDLYCFTVLYRLLTTGLHQFDACWRDFPGNRETCSLFAEFFIYSKHKLASAPRSPFLIRSAFYGRGLSKCRKLRHLTWQGPNAVLVALGFARNDLAGDPARRNTSIRLSYQALLKPHKCDATAESNRHMADPALAAGE